MTSSTASNITKYRIPLDITERPQRRQVEGVLQEREVLDRIKAGDEQAFWNYWKTRESSLRRLCERLLNADDAEDALHTAMLRAYEKTPRHADHIHSLGGWIARLTRNVCLELIRKNRKYVSGYEESESMSNDIGQTEAIVSESAESAFLRNESLAEAYRIIEKLPQRLRTAALLRFVFEMPHKEIAHHLNLTNENVRKRIQHARTQLQKELGGDFDPTTLAVSKRAGQSNLPAELRQANAVENLLQQNFREAEFRYEGSRVVRIAEEGQAEYCRRLLLTDRPARQQIKTRSLQRYVERYPRGWKNRLKLAELLYGAGQWDLTEIELGKILDKRPQTIQAAVLLGDLRLLRGRAAEAREAYKSVVGLCKKESTRLFLEGALAVCDRDHDLAADCFRKAAAAEPENPEHLRRLADIQFEAGRWLEARRTADELLEQHKDDLHGLLFRPEILEAEDRPEELQRRMTRALHVYKHEALALQQVAQARIYGGLVHGDEGKETRRYLRRLKRQAEDMAPSTEAHALYHLYKGESRKALETVREYAQAHPDEPDAHLLLARFLYWNGALHDAGEAAVTAAELDASYAPAHLLACDIATEAALEEDARRLTDTLEKRFAHRWDACAQAGWAAVRVLGRPEHAMELGKRAIELEPELPAARVACARILLQAGRPAEALEQLQIAHKMMPEDAGGDLFSRSAELAALCHERLEQPEKARRWRERLVDSLETLEKHQPALAAYRKGVALYDMHDVRGSARELRKALDLHLTYPMRQDARSLLRKIQGLRKRSETPAERNAG